MNGYFYTLLITSVCGGICALLAWGGFEKYIKYIAALICTVLVLSPFRDMDISDSAEDIMGEISVNYETSVQNMYALAGEMTEEKTKQYISDLVFSESGIKPTCVNIKIDWNKNDPVIENITVTLNSVDFSRAAEVKEYLFSVLGGEVSVVEG